MIFHLYELLGLIMMVTKRDITDIVMLQKDQGFYIMEISIPASDKEYRLGDMVAGEAWNITTKTSPLPK